MTYDSQGCGLETRRSAAGHYDTGVVGPGAVGTPPQPAQTLPATIRSVVNGQRILWGSLRYLVGKGKP